jgi:hypothetical protein
VEHKVPENPKKRSITPKTKKRFPKNPKKPKKR